MGDGLDKKNQCPGEGFELYEIHSRGSGNFRFEKGPKITLIVKQHHKMNEKMNT